MEIIIAIIVICYLISWCKKNNCTIKDFFFRKSIFDRDDEYEDDEDIIDEDDYNNKY